jgi:2-iminobutanoate/2-iminopropanoate deaminase
VGQTFHQKAIRKGYLMLRKIEPHGAPPAIGPFSQGIVAEGRLLAVSGQGPQRADGTMAIGDFETEATLTLDNLSRVLDAAGSSWEHVVRVGVYLARTSDFAAFNRIYAGYVGHAMPARTTIICTLLAGISVEVDCLAIVPDEATSG